MAVQVEVPLLRRIGYVEDRWLPSHRRASSPPVPPSGIPEGKTRREAIRCLKRYVARELYTLITRVHTTPQAHALVA